MRNLKHDIPKIIQNLGKENGEEAETGCINWIRKGVKTYETSKNYLLFEIGENM